MNKTSHTISDLYIRKQLGFLLPKSPSAERKEHDQPDAEKKSITTSEGRDWRDLVWLWQVGLEKHKTGARTLWERVAERRSLAKNERTGRFRLTCVRPNPGTLSVDMLFLTWWNGPQVLWVWEDYPGASRETLCNHRDASKAGGWVAQGGGHRNGGAP